ncbi:MAG: hypothetical protein A2Y71_13765 [Bacteroidetes bacterium RBG_13_42_15]|nr:MAG: hypothetical protein A2Y71_13765 [Bacteroidetes bacterium RBG_13_42_15]
MFRVAHNAGIDYFRKIKHANNYKIEVKAAPADIYENYDLEKDEQRATLEKAISKLKPNERELIVLGKINCLKYKEIADILNTTESNVKIRIFRILRKLKDIYTKLEKTGYEKARD